MAAIPIPKEVRPGIAALLRLNEDANHELLNALQNASPSFGYQQFAENVADSVKTIERDSAEDIASVLLSLHLIRTTANVELPSFIDDFVEGIEQTELKELLSKISVDKFKEWLSRFLQVKNLALPAKARAKRNEYENVFCSADISTDVRPLFESANGEGPAVMGALITFALKIGYHHGNQLRDFFVAMDSDDLNTLEELIAEARSQTKQLSPLLDTAQIPHPKNEG